MRARADARRMTSASGRLVYARALARAVRAYLDLRLGRGGGSTGAYDAPGAPYAPVEFGACRWTPRSPCCCSSSRRRGWSRSTQGRPSRGGPRFRAMTCDLVQPDQAVPVGKVEDLTVPGADGELAARVYRPEGVDPRPTLVYLHGGGFVIGDLDTHDQTCRRICRDADVVVLSVAYRLAPEHPFPAGVEDAVSRRGVGRGPPRRARRLRPAGGRRATAPVAASPRSSRRRCRIGWSARSCSTRRSTRSPTTPRAGRTGWATSSTTRRWSGSRATTSPASAADPTDPRLVPMLGSARGRPAGGGRHRGVRPPARRGRGVRRQARRGRRTRRPRAVRRSDPRLRRHGRHEHRLRGRAAADLDARIRRVLHGDDA